MPNAVNSAQYQARIKQAEALFEGQNFTRRQTINLGGGYEIVKDAYRLGATSFSGGEYTLFDTRKTQIISWRCIDDRAEFFSLIRHADGKFYLVFRQDLYGYSVLDLASAQIMRFVPDAWLDGKESFIWDGVHYLGGLGRAGRERLLLGGSKRRAFGELCRADERRAEICRRFRLHAGRLRHLRVS